jgi:hypothetical protein
LDPLLLFSLLLPDCDKINRRNAGLRSLKQPLGLSQLDS